MAAGSSNGVVLPISLQIQNMQEIANQMKAFAQKNVLSDSFSGKKINSELDAILRRLQQVEVRSKAAFKTDASFGSVETQVNGIETAMNHVRELFSQLSFSDLKLPPDMQSQFEAIGRQIDQIQDKMANLKVGAMEKLKLDQSFGLDLSQLFNPDRVGKLLNGSFDALQTAVTERAQGLESQLRVEAEKLRKAQEDFQMAAAGQGDSNMLRALEGLRAGFANPKKAPEWMTKNFSLTDDGKAFKTFISGGNHSTEFFKAMQQQYSLTDEQVAQIQERLRAQKGILGKTMGEVLRATVTGDGKAFLGKDQGAAQAIAQQYEAALKAQEEQAKRFEDVRKRLEAAQRAVNVVGGAGQGISTSLAPLQQQLSGAIGSLQQLEQAAVQNARSSNEMGNAFSQAGANVAQMREAVKQGAQDLTKLNTVTNKFSGITNFITRYMGAYAILRKVSTQIRNAIKEIKEIDKSITNIAVVTNMSQADLWNRIGEYTQIAQQYGVATKDVYTVSQIFYQQGLQTAQVMSLTTETLKMAKIAGMDYQSAANAMTVAVRAFKLEMTEAQQVTDTYSALAAKFAVSSAEIANAMEKTASSAASVGMSLQSTSAFMSVMIQTTRESAQNIGSAMKSIISRYGEMKASPDQLLNIDGEEAAFNKVDTALASIGISIKDASGQFRDFDDVIMELAAKWDTLDNNTQRYIATIMAGNRQQSRFIALVSNYDELNRAMQTANNAENASIVQVAKTMDSIETKTQQLQNAFSQLYLDLHIEDQLKGVLDAVTKIITTIGKMGMGGGILPSLMNIYGFGTGLRDTFNLGRDVFEEQAKKFRAKHEQTNGDQTKEQTQKIIQEVEKPRQMPVEVKINTKELDVVEQRIRSNSQLPLNVTAPGTTVAPSSETSAPQIQSSVDQAANAVVAGTNEVVTAAQQSATAVQTDLSQAVAAVEQGESQQVTITQEGESQQVAYTQQQAASSTALTAASTAAPTEDASIKSAAQQVVSIVQGAASTVVASEEAERTATENAQQAIQQAVTSGLATTQSNAAPEMADSSSLQEAAQAQTQAAQEEQRAAQAQQQAAQEEQSAAKAQEQAAVAEQQSSQKKDLAIPQVTGHGVIGIHNAGANPHGLKWSPYSLEAPQKIGSEGMVSSAAYNDQTIDSVMQSIGKGFEQRFGALNEAVGAATDAQIASLRATEQRTQEDLRAAYASGDRSKAELNAMTDAAMAATRHRELAQAKQEEINSIQQGIGVKNEEITAGLNVVTSDKQKELAAYEAKNADEAKVPAAKAAAAADMLKAGSASAGGGSGNKLTAWLGKDGNLMKSAMVGTMLARLVGTAVAAAGAQIEDKSTDTMETSKFVTATGNALSMAGTGASMLSAFGIPGMIIGAIGGALIGGLPGVIDAFDYSDEERYEAAKKEASQAKDTNLKEQAKVIDLEGQIDNIESLRKAMYDSEDDMKAYYEATNNLASTYPELISAYDTAGNAIIDLNAAENLLIQTRLTAASAASDAAEASMREQQAKLKLYESDFNQLQKPDEMTRNPLWDRWINHATDSIEHGNEKDIFSQTFGHLQIQNDDGEWESLTPTAFMELVKNNPGAQVQTVWDGQAYGEVKRASEMFAETLLSNDFQTALNNEREAALNEGRDTWAEKDITGLMELEGNVGLFSPNAGDIDISSNLNQQLKSLNEIVERNHERLGIKEKAKNGAYGWAAALIDSNGITEWNVENYTKAYNALADRLEQDQHTLEMLRQQFIEAISNESFTEVVASNKGLNNTRKNILTDSSSIFGSLITRMATQTADAAGFDLNKLYSSETTQAQAQQYQKSAAEEITNWTNTLTDSALENFISTMSNMSSYTSEGLFDQLGIEMTDETAALMAAISKEYEEQAKQARSRIVNILGKGENGAFKIADEFESLETFIADNTDLKNLYDNINALPPMYADYFADQLNDIRKIADSGYTELATGRLQVLESLAEQVNGLKNDEQKRGIMSIIKNTDLTDLDQINQAIENINTYASENNISAAEIKSVLDALDVAKNNLVLNIHTLVNQLIDSITEASSNVSSLVSANKSGMDFAAALKTFDTLQNASTETLNFDDYFKYDAALGKYVYTEKGLLEAIDNEEKKIQQRQEKLEQAKEQYKGIQENDNIKQINITDEKTRQTLRTNEQARSTQVAKWIKGLGLSNADQGTLNVYEDLLMRYAAEGEGTFEDFVQQLIDQNDAEAAAAQQVYDAFLDNKKNLYFQQIDWATLASGKDTNGANRFAVNQLAREMGLWNEQANKAGYWTIESEYVDEYGKIIDDTVKVFNEYSDESIVVKYYQQLIEQAGTDLEQVQALKAQRDATLRSMRGAKSVRKVNALSALLDKYTEVTNEELQEFQEAFGLSGEDLVKYVTWDYTNQRGRVNIKALQTDLPSLAKNNQEEANRLFQVINDTYQSNVTNAVSLLTKGATSYQEMQTFADTYSDITGDIQDIQYVWDDALKAWTISPETLRKFVKAQVEKLKELGFLTNEQVDQWIEANFNDTIRSNIKITDYLKSDRRERDETTLWNSIFNYYSAVMEMSNEEAIKWTNIRIGQLKSGGVVATTAAKALNPNLSNDELNTIFYSRVNELKNISQQATNLVAGSFAGMSGSLYNALRSLDMVRTDGVVKSTFDLVTVYKSIYETMQNTNGATVADLNSAYLDLINANQKGETDMIEALGKASSMSYSDLSTILTNNNKKLSDYVSEIGEVIGGATDWLEAIGGGKLRITNFEAFAAEMNWTPGSEEYLSAFNTYVDSMAKLNNNTEEQILTELKNAMGAKRGDAINFSYIYSRLDKQLVDSFNTMFKGIGLSLENGLLKIGKDANLLEAAQAIKVFGEQFKDELGDSFSELEDAFNELFDNIISIIKKGIGGTMTNADVTTLQSMGIDIDTNALIETANGLKLSQNEAFKLYNQLKQIDAIKAQLVFDELNSSLKEANENYKSVSDIMARIAFLRKQLYDEDSKISTARREEYERELEVAEEILAVRSTQEDDSFSFMSNKIPGAQNNPLNYYKNMAQAIKSIDEAFDVEKTYKTVGGTKRSGFIDYEDWYNIVNEMNRLAGMGEPIMFAGQQLDGSLEAAAALIEKGAASLTTIDTGELKVDLSAIGLSLSTGAAEMKNGIDEGIQRTAESQIKMLDGLISLLEVITTMEELGDLDLDSNGIDFSELFVIKKGPGFEPEVNWEQFNATYENFRQGILTKYKDYIEKGGAKGTSEYIDLGKALEGIKIQGGPKLIDLIKMNEQQLRQVPKQLQDAYTSLLTVFSEAARSGNYDLDNMAASLTQVLRENGLEDEIVIDMGDTSIIVTASGVSTIDWSDKAIQNILKAMNSKNAKTELTNIIAKKNKGETLTFDQIQYYLAYTGKIKYNATGEITSVTVNGIEYTNKDDIQAAILAAMIEDAGGVVNETSFTAARGQKENATEVEGTIEVGAAKVKMTAHNDGTTTYHSDETGKDYKTIEELETAEYNEWLKKEGYTYQDGDAMVQGARGKAELTREQWLYQKSKYKIAQNVTTELTDENGQKLNPKDNKEVMDKLNEIYTAPLDKVESYFPKDGSGNYVIEVGEGLTYTVSADDVEVDGKFSASKAQELAAKLAGKDSALIKNISEAVTNAFSDPDSVKKIITAFSEGLKTFFEAGQDGSNTDTGLTIPSITLNPAQLTIKLNEGTVPTLEEGTIIPDLPIPAIRAALTLLTVVWGANGASISASAEVQTALANWNDLSAGEKTAALSSIVLSLLNANAVTWATGGQANYEAQVQTLLNLLNANGSVENVDLVVKAFTLAAGLMTKFGKAANDPVTLALNKALSEAALTGNINNLKLLITALQQDGITWDSSLLDSETNSLKLGTVAAALLVNTLKVGLNSGATIDNTTVDDKGTVTLNFTEASAQITGISSFTIDPAAYDGLQTVVIKKSDGSEFQVQVPASLIPHFRPEDFNGNMVKMADGSEITVEAWLQLMLDNATAALENWRQENSQFTIYPVLGERNWASSGGSSLSDYKEQLEQAKNQSVITQPTAGSRVSGITDREILDYNEEKLNARETGIANLMESYSELKGNTGLQLLWSEYQTLLGEYDQDNPTFEQQKARDEALQQILQEIYKTIEKTEEEEQQKKGATPEGTEQPKKEEKEEGKPSSDSSDTQATSESPSEGDGITDAVAEGVRDGLEGSNLEEKPQVIQPAPTITTSPQTVAQASTPTPEGGGTSTQIEEPDVTPITDSSEIIEQATQQAGAAMQEVADQINNTASPLQIFTGGLQALSSAIASIPYKAATILALNQAINNIPDKPLINLKVKVSAEGDGKAAGNVSIEGANTFTIHKDLIPSWAKGNVALAGGRQTLMGELGPELVVSNGRYFVVGQGGAEMVNLDKDAIVFNHLQTQSLLRNGKAGRGRPVTNERNAVSWAKGSVNGGPAMASASALLAALKQLRAQWQALAKLSSKDLAGLGGSGGGGGGGGGGVDKAFIKQLERWYDLLQDIARIEKEITYEEKLRSKLESDLVKNGYEFYNSQERTLDLLKAQIKDQKELNESRQEYFNERRQTINKNTPFSKLYDFDEYGQLKYKEGPVTLGGTTYDSALTFLSMLNERDPVSGKAKYTAKRQLELLQAAGFLQPDAEGKYYDSSGTEIEQKEGWEATVVQSFWDKIDADRDEMQDLWNGIKDGEAGLLDLEKQENEILKAQQQNQLDLEQEVLKAITDSRQKQIDELKAEEEIIKKASSDYIDGLNDALSKERSMYENQKQDEELTKLQRQLSILQRTGGSASQIANLQQQIADKQQDIYFDKQQEQIDAIKDASDRQIEKMDQQIEIMTKQLEYEKTNGLLWNQVYEVMLGPESKILEFITTGQQGWDEKSALAKSSDMEGIKNMIQQFIGKRAGEEWSDFKEETSSGQYKNQWANEDTEKAARAKFTDVLRQGGTIEEARAAANQVFQEDINSHGWSTYSFAEGAAYKKYEKVWSAEIVQKAKDAYNAEYAKSGDRKKAAEAANKIFDIEVDKGKAVLDLQITHGDGTTTTKTYKEEKAKTWTIADLAKANAKTGDDTNKLTVSQEKVTANPGERKSATATFGTSTRKYPVTLYKYGPKGRTSITVNNDEEYDKAKKEGYFGYAKGGMVNHTGLAMLHGTKSNPEAVLNPEQTKILRDEILSNKPDSFFSLMQQLREEWKAQIQASSSTSTLAEQSAGAVIIEHAEVNLNAEITNDYDATRAGQRVYEELMAMARRAGAGNTIRR